ncbi:hypothetical protein ACI782_03555 [Geodermatophilus sp. SYSU D00703]
MSQTDQDAVPAELVEAAEVLSVREHVLDILLEKIDEDRFPSASMMDDVEQLLPPWRRREYADILLDKIRADRFPSRSLIQRVVRLSC